MKGRAVIGRVVPIPQGEWLNSKSYKKLDIVYSEGTGYIARKDVPTATPLNNTEYWQIIAEGIIGPTGPTGPQGKQGIQGETGEAAGFTAPTASVTGLSPDDNPTVSVDYSGENTAKKFSFSFGIPQGPTGPQGIQGETGNAAGFTAPTASVIKLSPDDNPTVIVDSSGENTDKLFNFTFGIPQGATGPTGEQGPKGETGGAYLPVFDVDFSDGVLYAYQYQEGPHFDIDSKGDLYLELRSE